MKQIKDTFFIVVGNMICSLGIGTIALRLGLSLGGVSGLAKVLHGILPISISILVLAVNLILFALAYFFVGKKFAMNSFLSVILFPVFLEIAQNITVLDCLKEDLLLGTLIGGILLGSGSGLILRGNGSSGGFDIIGVILNKYFNVKTGTIFENTKVSLKNWFIVIWMCMSHKGGLSSMEIQRTLKITQKTA